ncbi:putative disease resistance protein RGA3 isoform X1 [Gossypium arboreum]|uniref:putative disease resistance protein RGA3 isoform X1 n=1 Tax=Gossypium arboreum TaxID=29729 RepID=UPI0008192062|nr:putative disease resistance protein RGA3 isoform X1 [Gossypium arboreum]XP_052877794.1 putative disease resistance protein RGA3 isoform X1 [Gossypium arboreum]
MAEAIAFDIATELITKLSSRALSQLRLYWNLKHDIDHITRTVRTIKAVLLDAEEKSVTDNLVKVWLEELKDVLYDADDLLDDFSTEALRKDLMGGNKLTKEVCLFFSSSNQFAYGLKMGRKIKAIKARLASIRREANTFRFMQRDRPAETSFMTKKTQQTHSFEREDDIIGRDDDKAALLKLVLEFQSEENVYIIPIVGFGGLGKTALAQLVYNHEMVKNHFDLTMFACVSNYFDMKVIVANIIKSDQNLEMDELQKQLRDKIDGKKYLLVLDDIWNENPEQWSRLKKLLMGGAKGSRIIVTTRSLKVAEIANKCESHVLKLEGLSDDDAWSLFKKIAFEQRYADSTNSAFVEVGKQISKRCGGVPLAIRTVAGMLSLKKTAKEWHSFKDNELAKISEIEGDILPTLKLSYDHLPSHLKHCFAYCRLYPKDHEIHVQTLVQFWIAQGFVKQLNRSQSLEEIGFGYFKDLVDRSFFQEVVEYGIGDMRCKMHDLMHDLAESIAGIESSIVDSDKTASEVDEKYRHISINPSLIPLFKGKKLRTLLQSPNMGTQKLSEETWDFVIANCRCLRVLELYNLNLKTISPSIYKLKHLRYLDLSFNFGLQILPKSICKIQNLLVLKLDYCSGLQELPKKIEKLVNLTHLGCEGCNDLTHMPRGIGKLTSLETLSMFVGDKDGSHGGADLSELRELNNLRGELEIRNLGCVKHAKEKFKAANLKEKQHLRSLVLQWRRPFVDGAGHDDNKSLEYLQPHPNLKKLCIGGWMGDAKFPSWLSLLTNLVKITISDGNFKHLPSFAQFPCLQDLVICGLTELEYMDDNSPKGSQGEAQLFFPSLKVLCLLDCPNMKSWWRTTKPIDDDSNEDNTTVMGTSTMAFPCLSSLTISNCPFTSMPLYPSLDDDLRLVGTSPRPLKQTMKMNITSSTPSSSTSSLPLSKLKSLTLDNIEGLDTHTLEECLQHLTSLKDLEIWNCKEVDLEGMQWEALKNLSGLEILNIPKLVSLPRGLQHLTNLRLLRLTDLPNLTSLPDEMRCLTSLEYLQITEVPQLEERCRKDSGADWHKIAHIPKIRLYNE